MKPFILIRHLSSRSIYETARITEDRLTLAEIRAVGCWAYVSIPNEGPADSPCLIHFWHRRDLDPIIVARMLAHEMGHIADGGPKDWLIGSDAEEDRAEEFAEVAAETVRFLLAEGILTHQNTRRRTS